MAKIKKQLSQKQKFDLAMIYRPMFPELKNYKDENVINRIMDIGFDNYSDLTRFLDCYQDFISWRVFLTRGFTIKNPVYTYKRANNILDFQQFEDLIERYKTNFDKAHWSMITTKFICHIAYCKDRKDDFIRKYKEELNWLTISMDYSFNIDFFKEMFDYIIINNFIMYNTTSKSVKAKLNKIIRNAIKEELNNKNERKKCRTNKETGI